MKQSLIVVLVIVLLGGQMALAQSPSDAPRYVRYCDETRRIQGEADLRTAIDEVEPTLATIEEILTNFENGQMTYLEGINQVETILDGWETTNPLDNYDCLVHLRSDGTRLLYTLLAAMLYGQIPLNEQADAYMGNVREIIGTIRSESQAAFEYLAIPLPEPEPDIVEAPPDETDLATDDATPIPEAPPPADGEPRSVDQLTTILQDFLVNNDVTLLRDIDIIAVPNNITITIVMERFVSSAGQDFDYENSVFLLDLMSGLLFDWPELSEINQIRIETYQDEQLTLLVASSGEAYRQHFYDSALNREEFEDSLTVQEPS